MSRLGTYLDCLFGAEPASSYAELRWRLRNGRGMGRDFVSLASSERLARIIDARGKTTDLYLGVAPRPRQEGTRDAIDRCHVLFVDCDTSEAIAALEKFAPKPGMVVRSGSGVHAYWSLSPHVGAHELERANRRLSHLLGADMSATDAGRLLRPLSVGEVVGGCFLPACSFADASVAGAGCGRRRWVAPSVQVARRIPGPSQLRGVR